MTLVEQYKKMVFKIANKVQAKHDGLLDLAALESAALQGICEAERTFNPDSSASLKTWIFIHARRQVQAEACKQRKQLTENVSTTSAACTQGNLLDTLASESDVEDRINREQLHELLMKQVRKLPPAKQKLLVKMLAQGMTAAEYAEAEGCSQAKISYLYTTAVEQLRSLMRRDRIEVAF